MKPWSRSVLTSFASRWWPISWNLQWLTAAVAVLGAVLYLVLRVVASQFYTPLGLTVDDAGLGQLSMLVRTAVGVLFIALMSGAIWFSLIIGMVCAFLFQLRESALSQRNGRLIVGAAAAVAVFVILSALGSWLDGSGGELRRTLGAIVGSCSMTFPLGVLLCALLQTYRGALFIVALSLLVLIIGIGFKALAGVAGDDARAVLSGHAPPTDTGGVPVMPYRAHIAYVAVGDSTSAVTKRCVVFLGQDGRSVVVYDAKAKRSRLLPGDTAVAIDPRARTCPHKPTAKKRRTAGRS